MAIPEIILKTFWPSGAWSSLTSSNTTKQDPENFDEEVKSLVTAWLTLESLFILLLI